MQDSTWTKKLQNYFSFLTILILHSTCYHTNEPKIRISNLSNSPFPLVKYGIVFFKKKLLNMMISLQEKSLTNNMPFLLIQIKINFSFLETISIFLSLKRNYMQCNFSALTFSCLQFKRRIKLVIHIYI